MPTWTVDVDIATQKESGGHVELRRERRTIEGPDYQAAQLALHELIEADGVEAINGIYPPANQ